MALSTIGTAAIADDAVTSAKVDSTTAAFTVADLVVTNGITAGAGITAATSVTAGTELIGNVSGRILLDASASGTDVGEEFLLDASASGTDVGGKILFEEGTDDASTLLTNGLPAGITINSASLPTGSPLQVVQVTKLDKFSMTSSTFADVTGFAASITPSSSSSKILVMVSIGANCTPGSVAEFRLLRGGLGNSVAFSEILLADAEGNRARTTTTYYAGSGNNAAAGIGINFLDSPNTTSEITYKIMIRSNTNGTIVAVNRTQNDSDAASQSRQTSTITLMEIGA